MSCCFCPCYSGCAQGEYRGTEIAMTSVSNMTPLLDDHSVQWQSTLCESVQLCVIWVKVIGSKEYTLDETVAFNRAYMVTSDHTQTSHFWQVKQQQQACSAELSGT